MEEGKAQQDNRFLNEKQIAHMIYDNIKTSGAGEALLDFNDLLRVQLKNDNVQGSDTKWAKYCSPWKKLPMKIYWKYAQDAVAFLRGTETSDKENLPVILD